VFTSLKAGAGFKKEIKKSAPTFKLGIEKNEESRLIHARSKKIECFMSRNMKC
jgi:hypothetical protein